MTFKKKWIGIFVSILIVVAFIINFIPTWSLKTGSMQIIEGSWLNVYYEAEEAAAQDVFRLADQEAEGLASKLGFQEKQDVNIYIYDKQSTMQRKKYGFIGPLLGLDWYIGDNIGTNVILTSPANPGKAHDYQTVKSAVLHEVVHRYISVINPNVQLWLTEGAALYLSNGEPFYKDYLNYMHTPTYEETLTKNPIKFANAGGYTFAHTYIEYIDVTYGWESVLELIKTCDYPEELKISQEELYLEWVSYIQNYVR